MTAESARAMAGDAKNSPDIPGQYVSKCVTSTWSFITSSPPPHLSSYQTEIIDENWERIKLND
jgi:hypothetical protein